MSFCRASGGVGKKKNQLFLPLLLSLAPPTLLSSSVFPSLLSLSLPSLFLSSSTPSLMANFDNKRDFHRCLAPLFLTVKKEEGMSRIRERRESRFATFLLSSKFAIRDRGSKREERGTKGKKRRDTGPKEEYH